MATYNEPIRPFEVLLSEAPGSISRDKITIVAGNGVLAVGSVLGKLANGKYSLYDNVGSDGTETASAILLSSVDATSETTGVAICRIAEVKLSALSWSAAIPSGDLAVAKAAAITDLATNYIIVR